MTDPEIWFVRWVAATGVAAVVVLSVWAPFGVAVAVPAVTAAVAAVVGVGAMRRTRRDAIDRIASHQPSDASGDPVADAVAGRVALEREQTSRTAEDLRRSIGAAGVGVVLLEPDGRMLAGVGDVSMVTRRGRDPRVTSAALLALVARAIERGDVVTETMVMGLRSRSYQWVVVPLDDGKVGAVVSDVTEMERVQAMRRTFITDASHELRTPIASIRAMAEALQLSIGSDPGRSRHFAQRLEHEAVRMGRIVAELLDLSRLESADAEIEVFDVAAVVRREMDGLRAMAEAASVFLRDEVESARLEGDPADVALAVRNVVTNGVTYTPPLGTVEVTAGVRDGRVVVEVRDTGIGIPANEQDRIFNRFHRVDAARSRETGGTGLGLSIVRHAVERHGGSVSVRSVLGEGSVFTLDFGAAVE